MIIGIGAGNPDYITVQAIKAMQQVDIFFVTDKGEAKEDLLRVRTDICERHLSDRSYRVVQIQDPERDRSPHSYRAAVQTWHEQRRAIYERLIVEELDEDECGAFLVWGDPSLYDSIIRIVEQIDARGIVGFDYEIIPGISSIQALTARHKIPLNRIGEAVQITTGRQLAAASTVSDSDVVVMLDGECAFQTVTNEDVDIYWGAYLGTDDEILLSGKLQQMAQKIAEVRAQARLRKGWIMDTYLLRKSEPPAD
ncbi:MAG TPA: precorrin-6A synthase (deacetylating) [Steroidobacteraceae bacterium]|jgi:precorrin-6A synthase